MKEQPIGKHESFTIIFYLVEEITQHTLAPFEGSSKSSSAFLIIYTITFIALMHNLSNLAECSVSGHASIRSKIAI